MRQRAMSGTRRPLILSLSDFLSSVRRFRKLIVLFSLLSALLTFCYLLMRPIHFTARGIFRGNMAPPATSLFKVLEWCSEGEGYMAANGDTASFLRTPPVLEGVVRALDLQATLLEEKPFARLHELWYTFKTALFYQQIKNSTPPSRILNGAVAVSDTLPLPEENPSLILSQVYFSSEIASLLKIRFIDERHFLVSDKQGPLGQGCLKEPFYWKEGHFTLSKAETGGNKIKTDYGLSFLPMELAVESLRLSLKLIKDKENSTLIHIHYCHRDRKLAAQIVNSLMEQFQLYLKHEGERKITHQLGYLVQRQEQTLSQLEALMEQYKGHLLSHLESGEIITLEKELEFLAEKQGGYRETQRQLENEMHELACSLGWPEASCGALKQRLTETPPPAALPLSSIETTRQLIHQYQQQLDLFLLECARYEESLQQLRREEFASQVLPKLVADATLSAHFERMHNLHRRLADARNWTEKEREQLKEDLENERAFVTQHLCHLQEGTERQKDLLQERLKQLQHTLLALLGKQHTETVAALASLSKQAAHFPQQWITEQKIALSTSLYEEMMATITKMIEAKNISYNLDYLMATPLKLAVPPVLPDHPKLFLGMFLGGGLGAGILLFGLCIYQLWRGPSASAANLAHQGWQVVPHRERLAYLGHTLAERGPVVLICAPNPRALSGPLVDSLVKQGEKIYVVDLTLSPSQASSSQQNTLTQELALDRHFKTYLKQLQKNYDRILIFLHAHPESVRLHWLLPLVHTLLYGLSEETLSDLEVLPAHTLFLLDEQPAPPPYAVGDLVPLLSQLLENKVMKEGQGSN